jgi:signal transduction histidine kinase
MGSRSRSIRLRIYFLVAIPLVAMVGLLAYVAGTSVSNAIDLDRAPNLINKTSLPTADFVNYLQAERAAAVIYLFAPTPANLAAYDTAVASTSQNSKAFRAAMTSPATVRSETPGEAAAINAMLGNLGKLTLLEGAVRARAVKPLAALTAYSQGIAAEPALFLTEANSETNAGAVGQALGLIATVQAREELSQEWALLGGMLAGDRMTKNDRIAFTDAAATRQADLSSAQAVLTPANLAVYNAAQNGSAAAQGNLAEIEQALAGGAPISQLPTTPAQWQQTAGMLLEDYYRGGVTVSQAELVTDHQSSRSAWIRVAVTSGIALLALLLTIVVTTLVARGIIRRLRGLERSALTVAQHQLPDVIGRLRRGEDVDVEHETAPLQANPGSGRVGGDEIDRVGQSFDLVRQTAIRAAVEEARLRRGLNDVFRSLSRRSQSLLHRQLALLDQMERRATDPEALDDLFRLDHLTTRMRRHAEGLVILAGAPPGRSWSNPVRMIDVMRGAIAEVEDYARVAVATRSQAGLSGSAVADVIHLLAELIENATTLSPPYTSVRVSGDIVASGFAIEVEDRGLGMGPERMAELNERLASSPEFNPADSEQLGLFVVSQLAKRHGIRVTLKTSPYGGTSAIVLIPRQLVVTEDAFRPALGGEPVAIAMAQLPTDVDGEAPAGLPPAFSELDSVPELDGGPELDRLRGLGDLPGLGPAPAIRISGPLRRSEVLAAGGPGPVPETRPQPVLVPGTVPGTVPEPIIVPEPASTGSGPPAFDVFAPQRRGQHSAATDPGDSRLDRGMLPAPATPMTPVASALPGGAEPGSQDANGDSQGLPRRVRQASLAPQLRADPPQRRVTVAGAGPSSWPTPAEVRRTVSALQRGWQEGRSGPGAVPAEPAPPAAPASGGHDPGGHDSGGHDSGGHDSGGHDSGGHDSTADEQAGGKADGT